MYIYIYIIHTYMQVAVIIDFFSIMKKMGPYGEKHFQTETVDVDTNAFVFFDFPQNNIKSRREKLLTSKRRPPVFCIA